MGLRTLNQNRVTVNKREESLHAFELLGELCWNVTRVWAVGAAEGPSRGPREGSARLFILGPRTRLRVGSSSSAL